MMALYQTNPGAFDVDVYVIGHHGSPNATTDAFLESMSPEIGVISAGSADDRGPSSAWDHGHPRVAALDMLQQAPGIVAGARDAPISVRAFSAQETDPVLVSIDRQIYSTSWQGDLVLRATSNGD